MENLTTQKKTENGGNSQNKNGTSSAKQSQENQMNPYTIQEKTENEGNSPPNIGTSSAKQPQEDLNPYTIQEKTENEGNSPPNIGTSSAKQPHEDLNPYTIQEKTENEGNSPPNIGTSSAKQPQEDLNPYTIQEKTENGENSKENQKNSCAKQRENLPSLKFFTRQKKTQNGLHHGLYNQGATCYLNSVLQVLYMTTEIHNRLDTESRNTDKELRSIFETLKEENGQTQKLTECLQIENVNQQHDAAECLEMILNRISPQASEVFEGQLMYTTKCDKESHIINKEINPFWTLPLSLEDTSKQYSVAKNFHDFFQTSAYSEDDMVYCEECKEKQKATSVCEMVHSPQILTLLLKRFFFDGSTMSYLKSNRRVDVPLVIKTENKQYTLYGMVDHWGSLGNGHYTATLWSKKYKVWYEFNDAQVYQARAQLSAKQTNNSRTAYLLMYRGKDIKKWKLPSIPKGIKNKFTTLNKKKDDEAPSRKESVNSCEQQLDEEKSEGEEKQQGDGHTPIETKSEDVTDEGTKTHGERNDSKRKTEDRGGTDMRGDEENAGQMGRLVEEEKPSPQTEGSGGRAECEMNNGSVEEGTDMNTAAHGDLPLQREEDRGAQENKKPSIITRENRKSVALERRNEEKERAAFVTPEKLLQKSKAHLDKKRHLKVPKESDTERQQSVEITNHVTTGEAEYTLC